MPEAVSQSDLEHLGRLLQARMGWQFGGGRSQDLERGLANAARELGYAQVGLFVHRLLTEPWPQEIQEALGIHLTIGETYFWREPRSLEGFRDNAIPLLLQNAGGLPLRVWSAASATGEEAYSLALLLKEFLPAGTPTPEVWATDINQKFLTKARSGQYRQWSFRNTPQWILDKYLVPGPGDQRQVSSEIGSMVRFRDLNLARETYPSPFGTPEYFDAIFCRNVLIYFGPDEISAVTARLTNALRQGGFLVVSPSEVGRVQHPELARFQAGEATFFRRQPAREARMDGVAPGLDADNAPAGKRLRRAHPPLGSALPPHGGRPSQEETKPFLPGWPVREKLGGAQHPFPQKQRRATDFPPGWLTPRGATTGPSPSPVSPPENEGTADAVKAIQALADAGRLHEALALVRQEIGNAKANAELHFLEATILSGMQSPVEAVNSLRKALFLDHDFVLAHFLWGNISREMGQVSHARRQFQTVVELLAPLEPDAPVPHAAGLTAGRLRSMVTQALARMEK